jgi:hypothetical protein
MEHNLKVYRMSIVNQNLVLLYTNVFFFVRGEGPRSRCYGRTAALRLIVQLLWWRWTVFFYQVLQLIEHQWNEIDRRKPKYSGGKTCPSATLSTTNLTWTDPGSNPGLRVERPATNRLSHGTATLMCKSQILIWDSHKNGHFVKVFESFTLAKWPWRKWRRHAVRQGVSCRHEAVSYSSLV